MKFAGNLFFRTFAITALILLIFVFAGFAVNSLWMRPWGESARLHPPAPNGSFPGHGWFEPGGPSPSGGRPGPPVTGKRTVRSRGMKAGGFPPGPHP